jgi:hypothetical protein
MTMLLEFSSKAIKEVFHPLLLLLLLLGSNVKVGVIDYIVKIVGGALTFGFIAIELRRRFELRFGH